MYRIILEIYARGFAVLAVVSLILAGCTASANTDENIATGPVPVLLGPSDVAGVARGAVNRSVVVTGSLQPYRVVNVKAQAPGILRGLRIDRGSAVREGAVVARLEAEGINGMWASAKAGVAAVEAGLALAEAQLASARTLHDAGAMSDIDFKGVETAYEAARSNVAAARAQETAAREQARHTSVVAPITGQVSAREVEDGEAVNPGQTLFTIVDNARLELAGQIPVDEASQVKVGQKVVFTLDGYPGRAFDGRVDRIEPVADAQTRRIGIYLRMDNPGGELFGGLFATGRLFSASPVEGLLVPASAVQERGGAHFVFTIEGGTLHRRAVEIAAFDESTGLAAVASGLDEGMQVVVTPTGTLAEGAPVSLGASAPVASAEAKD